MRLDEADAPSPQADWARYGILRGLARTLRTPGDVVLAARIGWFLFLIPRRMADRPLKDVLDTAMQARRPSAADENEGTARIGRLRQAWLMMPVLRSRNTCYLRAITLFRFLDAGDRDLRIHFGVEPGVEPGDRLHGHAWVTVDGRLLEGPEPVLAGRVREIYVHPERALCDG